MSRTILKIGVVLVLIALAWKLVGGSDEESVEVES